MNGPQFCQYANATAGYQTPFFGFCHYSGDDHFFLPEEC
jgi:hypothetical protein